MNEEILENNALIARFMGLRQGHPDPGETRWKNDWFEPLLVDSDGEFTAGRRHEHLSFDYSWNWLMPVIRRILNLCSADDGPFVMEDYYGIIDQIPDIERTYATVVEFVKKFNDEYKEEAGEGEDTADPA